MVGRILCGCMIFSLITGCVPKPEKGGEKAMPTITGKKVLMVIASNNFRDEEYNEPRRILESQGALITVASSSLNTSRGILGSTAKPNILLSEVKAKDYDAILFIGGPGCHEYFNDPTAHTIAQESIKSNKLLCAICSSVATLANAGVLQGRRATVFSSEVPTLEAGGAVYTGADLEIDGNIITANGPGAASKFGEAILKALSER